ncbi:MAG TPA: STAS domain-containing protein [Vicinamibacterales bacterium]|nr:STAS domain-containing protein [Vicinamibacterales bacterium]
MQIRETRNGQIAVLQLSGRLTVNDQPGMLREAVTSSLTGGARHVLLDLSGVHYIDSTRLGEIISAHVTVTRRGGRLRLVGTPDRITELLAIAGLEGVFERFATTEEASLQLP